MMVKIKKVMIMVDDGDDGNDDGDLDENSYDDGKPFHPQRKFKT